MPIERPLLFFFSAIGAFNGLFLSTYFAFLVKEKTKATYFLAAFLLAASIRVIKSVFIYFYPQIPALFVQIGLAACVMIGPFLYLYVSARVENKQYERYTWLYHVVPGALSVVLFMNYYPYWQCQKVYCSLYFIYILYTQWIGYVVMSGIVIRDSFRKLFTSGEKLTDEEIWQVSLVVGIAIVWAAYNFSQYTSYISGAVSFSFIFYLLVLLWVFKRRKTPVFFEEPVKYSNKKISTEEADTIASQLDQLFAEKELHKNPNLKLSDVAEELGISPHYLSQYLNDNLGQRFSSFINAYRVEAAEAMLRTNHQLTLEAIGNECGFRSNSSFYAAFKKFKGATPAQYKKTVS